MNDLLTSIPMMTLARSQGIEAGQACLDKAIAVTDFDPAAARRFIVAHLRRWGQMSGEELVAAAKLHGHRPHSDRAFGTVFRMLIQQHQIHCLRSDLPRVRGHGTSGGKLYCAM